MLVPRQTIFAVSEALRVSDDPMRVVSVETDLDPLDLVRAGSEAFGWAGFYSSPDGASIGALGTAATFAASGTDRMASIDRAIHDLPAEAHLLVGFSFDDEGPSGTDWEGFPSAAAVLPEVTVVRAGGRSTLTVVVRPGSDGRALVAILSALRVPDAVVGDREVDHTVESRPLPDDWRELVGEAVGSISAGMFTKVVLARSVIVHTPRPLGPFDLAAQLRNRYPECRVFGWQQGDSTFLGASPELLVAREGERFQLGPLAGSAPRGDTPELDRELGNALLASAKDRLEHSIVVEDAVGRLADCTRGVTFPSAPVLQRFATVQHLATPISGSTDLRMLDLAGALHPTAAVGGYPRSAALAFIAKQEGIDRGWYSGGIGWVKPGGDGEMAVALRCALVRGDHAIVYAGNGIVDGSDPDRELAETRLKLRPMLDLLT
jgi:isochorismate synthase